MRIMAMGDSNTYGIIDKLNRESGGYRIKLDQKLEVAGYQSDFVGTLSSGPASDNQHEGYNGQTLDWLALKAHQVVPIHKPDVILLMAGSNDLKTDSLATMKTEMAKLLDVLSKDAPGATILVATLPPPQPGNTSGQSPALAAEFNKALPGIVAGKAAAGLKVKLVDTTSLTSADMSPIGPDAGVHLNAQGYEKMANFWFDAISKIGSGGVTPPPPPPPPTSGTGVGNPVVAVDDAYKIDSGKSLYFNTKYLTWNDKGLDGGLKVTSLEAVSANGFAVSWAADGTAIYKSGTGWNGVDRIDYKLSDADGSTDTGSVFVTVGTGVATIPPPPTLSSGAGNPVVAGDDTYKVVAGKSLYFATKYLLMNDKGADGGLKITNVAATTEKGVAITAGPDGSLVYKAPAGFVGTDHLSYTLTDLDGSSDIGIVNFVVNLT